MTRVDIDGDKKKPAPKVNPRTIKPNGPLIQAKRKALGLNVAAFAQKSGICVTTVRNAEKSLPVFTSTLKIIADTLRIDVKGLIHPDDPSAHC